VNEKNAKISYWNYKSRNKNGQILNSKIYDKYEKLVIFWRGTGGRKMWPFFRFRYVNANNAIFRTCRCIYKVPKNRFFSKMNEKTRGTFREIFILCCLQFVKDWFPFLDSTIITTIRLSIPTRNGWTIRLKVCFTFIVGNIVAITENFVKYC
jgi:hypothetical protein